MPLRPGETDVEQSPLVLELLAAGAPCRKLALLEPRDVDRFELESFRAMQRQQVHAAADARAEALLEARREAGDRPLAVVELLGQAHEPREIRLTRLFALAELLRHGREQPLGVCDGAHCRRHVRRAAVTQSLEELTRRIAREQRCALEGDAGVVEGLLEVGRARVGPHEHRLLLERHALLRQRANALGHRARLLVRIEAAAQLGERSGRDRRAQRLL